MPIPPDKITPRRLPVQSLSQLFGTLLRRGCAAPRVVRLCNQHLPATLEWTQNSVDDRSSLHTIYENGIALKGHLRGCGFGLPADAAIRTSLEDDPGRLTTVPESWTPFVRRY